MEISSLILTIIKNWWWFILLIILYFPSKFLYLWWIRWEVWYKKQNWILLEVKPPKEILKPFKAMENVFSILWGVYDGANWRERWCEGELIKGPYWISFEIASLGGEIHFFLRVLKIHREMVEAAIYSQYPDAEISLADDYTKNVPPDIPNKDWDLYGEDYSLIREDTYPIKTYLAFFEPRGEAVTQEEKRIDSIDSLLESLTKLKPSEQFWFQIVAAPILDKDIPWKTAGEKLRDKLARRKVPPKPRSLLQEVADVIITGTPTVSPPKVEEFLPPEMKLTPGERETLAAVENKISKYGFKTWIRIIYLHKREEPYFIGNNKIVRAYLNQFLAHGLNGFVYWGPARTRIHYVFRKRRLYMRKRNQFRHYIERLPSTFPRSMEGNLPLFHIGPKGPGIRATIILNTEELATIYHLPSKVIVPTLPYVEAKKGGPPPELPTE
jgi:hypothetical protein